VPGTTRFLIEQATVTVSPSAAVAFQKRETSAENQSSGMVFVGDPQPAANWFDDLPRLAGAGREVSLLAARHPDGRVLIGRDATPANVLSALTTARTLFIAAHAFALPDPKQSQIVLSPYCCLHQSHGC